MSIIGMFSVEEISRTKYKQRLTARQNDQSDPTMPSRTAREKRTASRLNLAAAEKGVGLNRSLSTLEEEFIYAAEFGDIPSVKRILEDNPNFNVDYNDIIGRTPLRLAVGNEHLEVVELLLDRSNVASIHEALLQAISAGHEQIAETILKHTKYRDIKKENKRFGETDYFFNTTAEDSPFSSDITPLILAAERNQFEIIQLLLLRGETINKPHHYYCVCQECSNKLQFDQLRLAKTRLNAYKGLASGAYISLSSTDPILTAFELARELRQVAKVEKYYKNDYLSLAEQLSSYVVKLLDKVRGHDELEKLLNKKSRECENETYELLARLKLAIHYNEKKFVAHPSCQQKLVSIWYDNLRSMERSNWFLRTLMVAGVSMVYPVMAILYMVLPKTKIGDFMRNPCIKFIGHTLSFITFLTMILISSILSEPSTQKRLSAFPQAYQHYYNVYYKRFSDQLPPDFVVRTCEPEVIHLLLSLWIIGMLWQEIKQLYSGGVYDYFDSLYNYLDVAVLTLYIASFTLRYISMYKVNAALLYFSEASAWTKLVNKHHQAEYEMYWLIADRLYWDGWDPFNIAEGLFAVANVISFTRITYILPANELFGPLQISIARMTTDIMKFMVIFLVVFFAFMVGLHNLYWYYPKENRKHVEFLPNDITTNAELAFGIPDITFRTVFWSLFGRGEHSVVQLGQFEHYFTQNVGYWIFGTYNIAMVLVLLNMLIAMMSRSFDTIQEDADTEWKFARSKLYMEYIRHDGTLPIPFNIIPTPKFCLGFMSACWAGLCHLSPEEAPQSHPGRIRDVEMFSGVQATPSSQTNEKPAPGWNSVRNGKSPKGIKRFQERMQTSNGFVRNDSDPNLFSSKLTYKRVMKRIVKRYIFDMQRESDASEGDFEEIKQDISSFRYEMLNNLSLRQSETHNIADTIEDVYSKLQSIQNKLNSILKQPNFSINDSLDDVTVNEAEKCEDHAHLWRPLQHIPEEKKSKIHEAPPIHDCDQKGIKSIDSSDEDEANNDSNDVIRLHDVDVHTNNNEDCHVIDEACRL